MPTLEWPGRCATAVQDSLFLCLMHDPEPSTGDRLIHTRLTGSSSNGKMPPREGPPMERRWSRVSRRQFVASAAGLGLVAGCGRLPWQAQEAPKVHRIGFLSIYTTPAYYEA